MYRVALIEDDLAAAQRVKDIFDNTEICEPWRTSTSNTPLQDQALQPQASFELLWHARSVAEARRHVVECSSPIDVILLDLGLPDGRGVDLIPALRQRWLGCVVVAFTVFGDQTTVLEAIEAGVDGYLLKTAASDDLLDTLISAARGESPISSAVAGFLLRRLRKTESATRQSAEEANRTSKRPEPVALTARERDVLESLARGYSYRETAKRLGMSTNTVAHHIKNLYPKLTSKSRSEAVFRAVQEGLITLEEH